MIPMLSDDCRKSLSQQAFKFHRTDGLSIYKHHDSFTVPVLIKMTALWTSVARCGNRQTSKMSTCKIASARRFHHSEAHVRRKPHLGGTGPRLAPTCGTCALETLEARGRGPQDVGRMGIPGRAQAPVRIGGSFREGEIADFSAKIRRYVAQIRKVYAGWEQFGMQALLIMWGIGYLRRGRRRGHCDCGRSGRSCL